MVSEHVGKTDQHRISEIRGGAVGGGPLYPALQVVEHAALVVEVTGLVDDVVDAAGERVHHRHRPAFGWGKQCDAEGEVLGLPAGESRAGRRSGIQRGTPTPPRGGPT